VCIYIYIYVYIYCMSIYIYSIYIYRLDARNVNVLVLLQLLQRQNIQNKIKKLLKKLVQHCTELTFLLHIFSNTNNKSNLI